MYRLIRARRRWRRRPSRSPGRRRAGGSRARRARPCGPRRCRGRGSRAPSADRRARRRRRRIEPPRAPPAPVRPRTSSSSETSALAAASTRTAGSDSARRATPCASGRSRASAIRTRWPPTPTTSASSPSIAPIVPRTPTDGASTGSPTASGALLRERSIERAQRPLGLRGARRTRRRGCGRAPARLARPAPVSRARPRAAGVARSGSPPAARRAPREPPRGRRAASAIASSRACAAEARTFSISAASSASRSRVRSPSSRTSARSRSAASRASSAARSAASASASSSAIRSRSGAIRPRAASTTAGSRPSRSAVCERVRRARPAERDPVERLVRLGIEPGRRVRGAVGRARPFLQLGVVRRHDRQPRLLGEPRQERLGERGSLDRIGARRELVDEDERAVGRRVEDRHQVPDVAGEGREAHLDRLLVADVGEHLVEDRQRRGRGGRAQPGLVEQRREAERLQGDRLAAGVRPAEDERSQRAEVEVDRNRGRGVEQRMARAEQPHLVADLDRRAAPAPGERAASEREVDRRGRLDQQLERRRALADGGRELAEDPLRPPRARRRRPPTGGCSARPPGTARRTASGPSRRRRGRFRARCSASSPSPPAPAAAALGDEVLLQVLAEARRAREPAQLVGDALPAVAQLAAELAKTRRGGVSKVGAVLLDAAADLLGERGERRVDRGSRARPGAAPTRRARRARPGPEPAADRDARPRSAPRW